MRFLSILSFPNVVMFSLHKQLYDWVQEHEEKVLNICYQFDPEEEDGSRKGKITKDNFVMCLQTISKSEQIHQECPY